MFQDRSSLSTNTGVAPTSMMTLDVATQEIGVVIGKQFHGRFGQPPELDGPTHWTPLFGIDDVTLRLKILQMLPDCHR